jgi:hypothetical protein
MDEGVRDSRRWRRWVGDDVSSRCVTCGCEIVTSPSSWQHSVVRAGRYEYAFTCLSWYCRARLEIDEFMRAIGTLADAGRGTYLETIAGLRRRYHLPQASS